MVWVKLSDTFAEDPRLERAGAQAFVMHVAALCYCNRNLTDGQISKGAARRLWSVDDPDAAIAALVEHGIWEATSDGYELIGFADEQPTAEKVRHQQALKAKRQAKWVAKRDASSDASRDMAVDAAPPRPAPPRRKAGAGGRSRGSASAPPPAPRPKKDNPEKLRANQPLVAESRVEHQAFGLGTVQFVRREAGHDKAQINFDAAGPKLLLLPNALLKAVS